MENKCVIIFTGYNNRATYSFIKTLDSNFIDYILIARDSEDSVLNSKFKDKVSIIRKNLNLNEDELESIFENINKKHTFSSYLIAPNTEYLIRNLLKHVETLQKWNVELPVVSLEIYQKISDKYYFGMLCKENDISVPNEIDLEKKIKFPIIAKPKSYLNGMERPVFINNRLELNEFKLRLDFKKYYFQEVIEGESYYLLYYIYKNSDEINKFSQKNLLQESDGGSIIAAQVSNIHNHKISYQFEKLLLKIGFYGLIMIEVKYDGEKFVMIEANPRLWGPSQLFLNAGVNLFESFLYDNGLLEKNVLLLQKNINIKAKYLWVDGLKNMLRKEKKITEYNNALDEILDNLEEWLKYKVDSL